MNQKAIGQVGQATCKRLTRGGFSSVMGSGRARGGELVDGWPLAGGLWSRCLVARDRKRKVVSVPRTASRKGPPTTSHPPLSLLHAHSSSTNLPVSPLPGGLERGLLLTILVMLLFLLTGCQFTQSPFVITVGNAGAAFAAASTTLTYVHTGKISIQYAQASFVNYQSQLDGLDQQLPSQQGAPDKHTIEHLLALYTPAMRAVNAPCLTGGCNWQEQVTLLNRVSQAFLKAGGQ